MLLNCSWVKRLQISIKLIKKKKEKQKSRQSKFQLYSTPIDLWSVGCMMAEFILLKPLLPGKGETDQIEKIFHELGTPSEAIWPGFSELPYVKNVRFYLFIYFSQKLTILAMESWVAIWNFLRCILQSKYFQCAFPNYQYNQLRKKFPANQLNQGGWELLNKFLTYDPEKRITASQALEHQWFKWVSNFYIQFVQSILNLSFM